MLEEFCQKLEQRNFIFGPVSEEQLLKSKTNQVKPEE